MEENKENKVLNVDFGKKQDQSKEKVIMEAKLEGGDDNSKAFKINETQAIVEIAKTLIQDFTFTITINAIKMILNKNPDAKKILDDIKDVWLKRTSAALADEEKRYQDAIFGSLQNQKTISQDTSEKIKKYMEAYCVVRDKAVETAKAAVDDIIKAIVTDNTKKEEKNEESASK